MSVAGARPNFMKIAAISSAIESHNRAGLSPPIRHVLIHTGQHYDDRLSQCFFEDLELPKPEMNLDVGSDSHGRQTAEIMKRFEPVLLTIAPDVLLVVGDVNSTIACTLVAAKINYGQNSPKGLTRPLIAHVEAGLRSGDRTMPEEINRILTDAISDLLFVSEEDGVRNLKKEGIPQDKIHFVGNVMIDTLLRNLEKARSSSIKNSLGLNGNPYGLITLHRPSNVDAPETLHPLMDCLLEIGRKIPLIFPVHPRTRANLKRFGFLEDHFRNNGIRMIDPLGYLDFLNLVDTAAIVLTDSGGIQEETTVLQVPCITLRQNTERPITVEIGSNYLTGADYPAVLKTIENIFSGRGKKASIPPLWDGKTGERIVKVLRSGIIN
jgi:UDP-N-acetylglucosamine 2-epimerase (non-hydrolysing)